MKREKLTTPWLTDWHPSRNQDVADRMAPGLYVRGGRSGVKVFFRWVSDPERDEKGRRKRKRETLGHWPVMSLASARARVTGAKEARGLASYTATVGELLDLYIARGQASGYSARILRKHLDPVRNLPAVTLPDDALPDLVAKVQKGYTDATGRHLGGPAVADKVRSGIRSVLEWAQRQGKFPKDRPLPTLGLVEKGDFDGIGWKARERVPSEGELHRLFDALGIGAGPEIDIDEDVGRAPLATRLAVLLLAHVPVRSGVGLLSQPASAADLDAGVLRWTTHKGGRDDTLETPLSSVAKQIVGRLRKLPGGEAWLVPSPEEPRDPKAPRQPLSKKALARIFARLQSPGRKGTPPRVPTDSGKEAFVPHALRSLWTSLAGDLGIDDGVAVRVIGHKPEGASAAHRFYDRSERTDLQRRAVEIVSAELERIRRRQPREAATIVPLNEARKGA